MLTITKQQREEIAKLQEVLDVAKTLPEEARLNIEKQVMDLVEKMAELQVIKHQLALVSSGLKIGQTFTTQSSGVVGIVEEVVENATGSFRVRLNVNGVERWTTFKKELAQ